MIVRDAAEKVLSMLELEDEEEYNLSKAVEHVNQAIYELAEENEFSFFDRIAVCSIRNATYVSNEMVNTPEISYGAPAYWVDVPGRLPLVGITGIPWDEFAYIKRGWISINDLQHPFKEMPIEKLLDNYGDSEGQPEAFSINGEYLYFRPIPSFNVSYTVRFLYQALPRIYAIDDSPIPLSVMPYVVIYKACSLACLWIQDDSRIPIFETLQLKAFDRFNVRQSMTGDASSSMEDYNG
jgi:hypothetical protein